MNRLGRSHLTTSNAVRQLAVSHVAGAQPIFTLGHLAATTNVPLARLRAIVDRHIDPYRQFSIRKHNGGTRDIAAPETDLLLAQQWLLKWTLRGVAAHPASYAYEPGRSALECARRHCNARWLIKLDLRDYFHSIDEVSVHDVFRKAGYSPLVAFQLARLTTRKTRQERQGHLPQGAPTSGALANRVSRRMDQRLDAFAVEHGLIYTRYSDDMFFSASHDLRSAIPGILANIERIVRSSRFALNQSKTRVCPPGARRVMLGVSVAEPLPRLTPQYKNRLQTHLRGVDKWGLVTHCQQYRFDSLVGFVRHVEGLLAYAAAVDPVWVAVPRRRWLSLLDRAGFVR
jgi:RNA-directed DNA polymerase